MVFEKFTSADLFQIAREKSCDYLLISMCKHLTCFSSFTCHRLSPLPVPAYKWQPRYLEEDWSKFWQVNRDKNASAGNLFSKKLKRFDILRF